MRMNPHDIHNAVLEYLDLIEKGKGDAEENLQALELSLDKLALAHNFIEYQFDATHHPKAPGQDYERLRKLAEARFPDFGYYNTPVCITEKIAESEMSVGDPIDDVADITGRDKREWSG